MHQTVVIRELGHAYGAVVELHCCGAVVTVGRARHTPLCGGPQRLWHTQPGEVAHIVQGWRYVRSCGQQRAMCAPMRQNTSSVVSAGIAVVGSAQTEAAMSTASGWRYNTAACTQVRVNNHKTIKEKAKWTTTRDPALFQ